MGSKTENQVSVDQNQMSMSDLYNLLVAHSNEQTKLIRQEIQESVLKATEHTTQIANELQVVRKRCIQLERRLRRNNIVIFGLNLKSDDLLQETLDTLNVHLRTDFISADINNVKKIGKKQNPPIILEFVSFLKKSTVFKNVKNLKGTGIAISNDLCAEDREANKVFVKYYKQARAENIKAKIQGDRLVVDGKTYTVDDLNELVEGEFVSDSGDDGNETGSVGDPPAVTGGISQPRCGNGSGSRKILKPSPPKSAITTRRKK